MKNRLKKYLIPPERLRGEFIHRILGDRIFEWDLWHFNRRSVAGGAAVGLFIALTPTIPFQMLLSALGAIWFRVNLPVALLASWLTNPFTAVWFYLLSHRVGKALIGNLPGSLVVSDLEEVTAVRRLFTHGVSLWTGGVVLGIVAAILGYFAVQVIWRLFIRKEHPHPAQPSDTEG